MGTLTVKEGAMTALPSKYSRGFHMATEAEDDQRTLQYMKERSGEGDVDSRIQVKYWRKMEAAAQNRAENGQELSIRFTGSDKA